MGYAKRYRKRNYRGKRRGGKKKLTLSKRQAATKKYDSVVEKVMARVAQQEIRKNEVRLISREFLFGSYDKVAQFWSGGLLMDISGSVVPLSNIPLTDMNISPFGGGQITDIPETMDDESAPYTDGAAAGYLKETIHGYRRADFIKVSGFNFYLRGLVDKRVEGLDMLLERSEVRWRLVALRTTDAHIAGWEPDPREVFPWPRPAGYSAKLDHAEAQLQDDMKIRIVAKGTMKFTYSTSRCDLKERFWNVSLKKPITIQYKPGSVGGEDHEGVRLYLVIKGDVSTEANHESYRPKLHAVSKLYYKDV